MQSPERQVERVLLELRQMVLRGEFPTGSRVPEIPVAQRLGVSRTPVRLALGQLEQEGLLRSSPRRGFVVREITVAQIDDAYEVRGTLEGLACRLAVEKGVDAATIAQLDACLASGDRLLSKGRFSDADTVAWSEMNERFHRAIVEAAKNVPLADAIAMNARTPLVAPGSIPFVPLNLDASFQNMRQVQAEHRAIADALTRGQSTRSGALSEEHAFRARERLRAKLELLQSHDPTTNVLGLSLLTNQRAGRAHAEG
jgi:GntR family transcriptional regulator of vanillate catabolism